MKYDILHVKCLKITCEYSTCEIQLQVLKHMFSYEHVKVDISCEGCCFHLWFFTFQM